MSTRAIIRFKQYHLGLIDLQNQLVTAHKYENWEALNIWADIINLFYFMEIEQLLWRDPVQSLKMSRVLHFMWEEENILFTSSQIN